MKLTRIRNVGRFINPETGRAVNVKRGTRAGRNTDHLFYLQSGRRVYIGDATFKLWKRGEETKA